MSPFVSSRFLFPRAGSAWRITYPDNRSPACTGVSSTYTVPSTGCRVGPPLHPAARAAAATRPVSTTCARLVATDHLPAADRGRGPVQVEWDRVADEPDRPVAQGELQPARVAAAERVPGRPLAEPRGRPERGDGDPDVGRDGAGAD